MFIKCSIDYEIKYNLQLLKVSFAIILLYFIINKVFIYI